MQRNERGKKRSENDAARPMSLVLLVGGDLRLGREDKRL
jgi:hypothetical protein